jgi:2-polyprenyl-6-methoxyphenol hydroxylase-like FAD-dependent oxidoreductase
MCWSWGAGIDGSTLAVLLARGGVSTTLVERAGDPRSAGGPVDVRGAALQVVARMGLLQSLRAAATEVTRLAVVDCVGRVIGWIPTQTSTDAIEIARSDLASILVGAVGDDVKIFYGDTVKALDDDGAGVDVRFERAAPRHFDLVIGADGLHSQVRRLAFGAEQHFTRPLGMYIATTPLETTAPDLHTVFLYSRPGRAAMIHPTTGREGAAFIFRHRSPIQSGERVDPHHQNRLLTGVYAGMGWRVPEMLGRIRTAEDVYFDAINRVQVHRWSRNRVVLVGDAAGCVTVFGEGQHGHRRRGHSRSGRDGLDRLSRGPRVVRTWASEADRSSAPRHRPDGALPRPRQPGWRCLSRRRGAHLAGRRCGGPTALDTGLAPVPGDRHQRDADR